MKFLFLILVLNLSISSLQAQSDSRASEVLREFYEAETERIAKERDAILELETQLEKLEKKKLTTGAVGYSITAGSTLFALFKTVLNLQPKTQAKLPRKGKGKGKGKIMKTLVDFFITNPFVVGLTGMVLTNNSIEITEAQMEKIKAVIKDKKNRIQSMRETNFEIGDSLNN